MNIMTKRGSLDNVVTYEHVCDAISDLQNISSKYTTLGSIAMVLNGESGGLEVYIANSNSEWKLLSSGDGSDGSGQTTDAMEIHICSNNEYDAETGLPTVEEPMEKTLYIVPATQEQALEGNLFNEYIFINNAWERFGGGAATISGVQPDWNQNDSSTADFIKNRPFYEAYEQDVVYEGRTTSPTIQQLSSYKMVSFQDGALDLGAIQNNYTIRLEINNQVFTGVVNKYYDDDDYLVCKGSFDEPDISANFGNGYLTFYLNGEYNNIEPEYVHIQIAGLSQKIYKLDEKFYNAPTVRGLSDHPSNGSVVMKSINSSFYNPAPEDCQSYGTKALVIGKTNRNAASYAIMCGNMNTCYDGANNLIGGEHNTAYNLQDGLIFGAYCYSNDSYYNVGEYSSTATYAENDVRIYDGVRYRSLVNNNKNHIPDSSPTYWEVDTTVLHAPSNVINHYLERVGNGFDSEHESNARTLDWNGNEILFGNLTAKGGSITIGSTTITEQQLQALLNLLQ